jgi:L-asparaginase II
VSPYEPLVETTRGGRVESVHVGALVLVDADGATRWSIGDAGLLNFPRSSLKPFQLLSLVEAGGVERFGLTTVDLAVAAASHSGEEIHVQAVQQLLSKIGAAPSDLACGVHEPSDAAAARRLRDRHETPNALHNNCSGKHAGMLALARALGAPLDGYLDLDHPVQRRIRACLVEVLELDENDLTVGIDGCSAPAYAVPLDHMARGFAWLGDASRAPVRWRKPLERVSAAMRLHPELVAGTHGRVDTDVMRHASGAVVAKGGAEGYFCMGHRDGLGLAFKIMDGDAARRARSAVVAGAAERLGWVPAGALADYGPCLPITNWAGRTTGEVRAVLGGDGRG